MEMASKGDGGTTDIFAKHMKSNNIDGLTGEFPDLYSAFKDEHMLFSFGQGTTKSRGDVYFSFLYECQMSNVKMSFFTAVTKNTPFEFFVLNLILQHCAKSLSSCFYLI